jgi:hypothetical protein
MKNNNNLPTTARPLDNDEYNINMVDQYSHVTMLNGWFHPRDRTNHVTRQSPTTAHPQCINKNKSQN